MRALGVICAGAAVLALAGCGQGENGGGEGATAAGENSSGASANAGGVREARTAEAVTAMIAKRRPGKWRMSMGLGDTASTPPTEICLTQEQIDNEPAFDPKQSGAACPDFRARRQGDTIVMTATCPDDQGGSTYLESKLIGDFQTRYRVESLIRRTAGANGPPGGEMRTFLDMTYVGPC